MNDLRAYLFIKRPANKRRSLDLHAKNCVPNRANGQDLCPNQASIYVPSRRKSLIANKAVAKIYVRHHPWCGT